MVSTGGIHQIQSLFLLKQSFTEIELVHQTIGSNSFILLSWSYNNCYINKTKIIRRPLYINILTCWHVDTFTHIWPVFSFLKYIRMWKKLISWVLRNGPRSQEILPVTQCLAATLHVRPTPMAATWSETSFHHIDDTKKLTESCRRKSNGSTITHIEKIRRTRKSNACKRQKRWGAGIERVLGEWIEGYTGNYAKQKKSGVNIIEDVVNIISLIKVDAIEPKRRKVNSLDQKVAAG